MPALARQYELVYIVRPDFTEEQVQAIITKYNGIITTQGGNLERTDIWERRRLAYEIKGQTEGIYIVSVFRALPNVEAELRRVFRISEDTLRSIIVKPDEEIDPSVPSVQPRDFSARQPYIPAQHAPVAQVAAAPVAVAEPVEAETPTESPAGDPEADIEPETTEEAPAETETETEVDAEA